MDLPSLPLPDLASLHFLNALPETITAALVSAVATIGLIAGFSGRLRSRPAAAADEETAALEFLIDGASVKPLTSGARRVMEALAPGSTRLAALGRHFTTDCPNLAGDLETLVLHGTPFRHHCLRGDGSALEFAGEPRGGAARLSIRPASEDAQALREVRVALTRANEEAEFLRGVLDRAPLLAWSHGPDGQVAWTNAPYRDRFGSVATGLPDERIPDAFGHTIEEVPLTARGIGSGSRRRVAVPGHDEAAPAWFEVSRAGGPGGESLGFALEAGEIVAAEATLRRFVETLTETFAHLPIGLAVFDKNRRLGLFNPALTDLVKIDAVWLAGRPSLRDFLERLRETRQMPEQKDFASWRRKLSELEKGAREGTYEENWVLPSGKIFRVTGRPHPQGALAFLFEDISTTIMLERKYRCELELSQATLDRLTEAVVVFDASGTLAFVNSAFERLWQLDPMTRLHAPGIAEMVTLWAERSGPSPVWARIAEFATAGGARASWTDEVVTGDGRRIGVLVAPLPDTSALVVFEDRPAAARPADRPVALMDDGLADLALDLLRLPAEVALQKLMSAIPGAPSAGAFQALSSAAQGLREGLARADDLRAARAGLAESPAGPFPGLTAALGRRSLSLAVPPDAADWPAELRRAAFSLSLAAADLAEPGGTVELALAADGRALSASVAVVTSGRSDGPGVALARRLAEAGGGALSVNRSGGGVTLAVTLPAAEEPAVRRRA
ncbi:PAS domain-containing protein [Amaricoccus macauensis]|uniref:PAS domain-containing protein n=1 Tax=Amaricoccus macauensis TaxID=57001 RepID=A0A840SL93_9RHOB|nr:PAS-domain containing protein [Amaricoccus macauensis]MBB5223879.1 PAS domain-containing protein [Amaricoccus macauensis]